MKLDKALATVAAVSLMAAPVAAQAATEVSPMREAAAVEGEELGGSLIVPLIALLAVVVGVLLIANGSDDTPESP